MSILHNFWNLLWTWGWLGFLGTLAYTFTGLVVYCNTLNRRCERSSYARTGKYPGKLHFFKFLIFSLVCGPAGWIAFPVWVLVKIISLVDLDELAEWISTQGIKE